METTRPILVLLAFMSITFSCSKPQPEASSLLERAEQLIEINLDSAMILIDSIYYPEKSFNKEDFMRYVVRRVQIRHKKYLPISEDTLIFDAKKHFTTKSLDPEMSGLASYYSGCVWRERGDLHQAMLDYKEAVSFATITDNDALKGMIQYNLGELFKEHGLFEEALNNYLLAEKIYRLSPEDYRDKEVLCHSEIGQMYIMLKKQDSAFAYLDKGLSIAKAINDRKLQSLLAQNLSVSYSTIGKYDQAYAYLYQSINLKEDSSISPVYYLNLSELYTNTAQKDSVSYYVDKLVATVDSTTNLYFKASSYYFLANYFKDIKEYDLAFEFQKKGMKLLKK